MCFSANCKAGNVALTQLYTSAFVYKFVYGMVASLLSAHLHSLIRLPLAPHFSARSYASLFTSPLVHLLYPSQHRSPIFHSPLFSTRRFVYHTIQFVISRLGTHAAYTHLRRIKKEDYCLSRSRTHARLH